ncbi:SAM-dependent methyltransferase [Ignavibacterium album JCM 16511]|uniref:SAM-dependent methyltransferase n=1 Tax=Ignavibacterium album (strain DSM 19864 / JCM 16511 / NBRC 101810 / Mat9-16) TaxID=945713 RepID=I0AM20_IGNAJ|nr:methyltransferase domain-containing protein [Ignavibacterium album]AFH50027.1 SAM-dependent methyltransferase [Ignavibacterium album JCM 16511]
MSDVNKPEFWNELYINNSAAWDLKSPTPAFIDLLSSEYFDGRKKFLVVGCGYGYDAIEAAKKGFEVTALDFSEKAIEFARSLAQKEKVNINFLVEDFFNLNNTFSNSFEIIFDYVTYCAIDPKRRKEYADKIYQLLKPEGIFAIILFPIENRIGGPPFAVDVNEATDLFSEKLELIISTDKINSIKPRKGRELLQIYRRANGKKS